MTSDTPSDEITVRRMEFVTVGARQRWSDDAKRALVLETFAPGASVSGVARRHGVSPSLAFSWRKRMREELGIPRGAKSAPMEPAGFMSLVVADAPGARTETPSAIEVELPGGVRVRICSAANPELVAAILKALARR